MRAWPINCTRTQVILSANEKTPVNIEALTNDIDFRSAITRAEFEELCADEIARSIKPVERLLEQTGKAPADVHAVVVSKPCMTDIFLHFLCAHYITDSLLCAQVVAILEGQFDVCKMLCEDYGADVNSKGPCGQSLLHYACATVRPGEQPVSSW